MKTTSIADFRELIASDAVKNVILDTDAYNEVDDQFCLAYLMLSPKKVNLLSVNAAPFYNSRSTSAGDGMEKSYQEILKVMKLTDPDAKIPAYRGSAAFLADHHTPVESDAAENIIRTVQTSEEPVVIIAIGALTNVASALLKCPEIAQHAYLIWLGGHAYTEPQRWVEFNLGGDIFASQIVFDSGIPMVQVPCNGVCTEVHTTEPELREFLNGKNELCTYLYENVAKEIRAAKARGKFAPSRIIWDITAAAILLCKNSYELIEVPQPTILNDGKYLHDPLRKHFLYVRRLRRDYIFGDLFRTLTGEQE